VHKMLWARAEKLLPPTRGADYTQAIMDLGATVCTRARPACSHCPVAADCRARLTNRLAEFPAPRPRLKIAKKSFRMLILTDASGRVLLERRPAVGIWGGLWSLPADDAGQPLARRYATGSDQLQPLPTLQHQLTHLKMTIYPFMGAAKSVIKGVECSRGQDWFGPLEWPKLGLPKPVRQLLETHVSNARNG